MRPKAKIHVVTREGVKQTIKQPTELVSNVTMKLINLQATQGNDLAMRMQTDLMEEMQNQGLINIVGQRVDETYFVYNSVEMGIARPCSMIQWSRQSQRYFTPTGSQCFASSANPSSAYLVPNLNISPDSHITLCQRAHGTGLMS